VHRRPTARRECWPRPIEVADHQDQPACAPDLHVLKQSERKTCVYGDAEGPSGRETRVNSRGLIVGSNVWHRRAHLIGKAFAVSLLAVEGPAGPIEHPVDLARDDVVQSFDFLGA
jgi:hypothetical protein